MTAPSQPRRLTALVVAAVALLAVVADAAYERPKPGLRATGMGRRFASDGSLGSQQRAAPQLVFRSSGLAVGRSGRSESQLQCTGGTADCDPRWLPKSVTCRQLGVRGDSVMWSCQGALDPRVELADTNVVCEGYKPTDVRMLEGACILYYTLNKRILDADPDEGPDAQLLAGVDRLELDAYRLSRGRRTRPEPQMQCVGGTAGCAAEYVPQAAICFNRGVDRRGRVQWDCRADDMDPHVKMGKTSISCEGYLHPEDANVLRGSCMLRYTLDWEVVPADAVRRSDLHVLEFRKFRMTQSRISGGAQPQLQCVGGETECQSHLRPALVRCEQLGVDADTGDPLWDCHIAGHERPPNVKLSNVEVRCEGYTRPGDPYVLRNSCRVRYRLDWIVDYAAELLAAQRLRAEMQDLQYAREADGLADDIERLADLAYRQGRSLHGDSAEYDVPGVRKERDNGDDAESTSKPMTRAEKQAAAEAAAATAASAADDADDEASERHRQHLKRMRQKHRRAAAAEAADSKKNALGLTDDDDDDKEGKEHSDGSGSAAKRHVEGQHQHHHQQQQADGDDGSLMSKIDVDALKKMGRRALQTASRVLQWLLVNGWLLCGRGADELAPLLGTEDVHAVQLGLAAVLALVVVSVVRSLLSSSPPTKKKKGKAQKSKAVGEGSSRRATNDSGSDDKDNDDDDDDDE